MQLPVSYNIIVTYERLIRYCSEDIITKVTFSYTSVTKLQTEFFRKLCENLFLKIDIFWIVILTDLA